MPATEPRLDRLASQLASHWDDVSHVLLSRKLFASLYGEIVKELSPVQLRALTVLAEGDLRMRELAARLGLAESTVTRLVDRLESAGLAERRSHRPDRRSVLVGLSAQGREAVSAAAARLRELLRDLLKTLPPQEQRELTRLLAKLVQALRAQAGGVAPAATE